MENFEYLAGSTRPPFTLAEIIIFLTVIYLFMGPGGNWQILLAVLLLIYWFALMAGKLWPPPKFDFPKTPLIRKSSSPNTPTKANFIWSPEYKVGFWWYFPPVKKYVLIHHRAIEERILTEDDFIKPTPLRDQDLALVHGRAYLWRLYLLSITPLCFLNGENPISFKILKKLKVVCGGTYLACKIALEQQMGMNLGGGFHHAFACHEEGFCHLNDMSIAIRKLQTERLINRAMIIDCDLHQGNGTASIFESDETVFTFSIHQDDLYPYPKQYSNCDISLLRNQRVDDKRYLEELKILPTLIQEHRPDLIIYLAGADPFQYDRLGGFLLTKQGLKDRDAYVLRVCAEVDIPTAIVLGGGYAPNIDDIVEIHLNTIRVVHKLLKADV
ncbi:MAG: histone deacetylase [Desulfobacterales bacterium]|nr:MAG: histone deacetylase [Desulfobacterales bacterium]